LTKRNNPPPSLNLKGFSRGLDPEITAFVSISGGNTFWRDLLPPLITPTWGWLSMDVTEQQCCKNTEKTRVFQRFVEVGGRRWMMKWWPGRELNPRHADFQSAALPTELPGHCEARIKQAHASIVNE
jgi:hypothetical protein